MTDLPCHYWLQKKLVWPTNKAALLVLQTFMHQVVDAILCTLSPHHNVHRENGVYQQWTTYALKSKSVPEMHFTAIWKSKFTDLANSKKTQSLGKNGCRQKCLNKSLEIKFIFTSNTARNTVISSKFLVWKFCGKYKKIQFPSKTMRNCTFPQNFHSREIRWNYDIFCSERFRCCHGKS